MSSKKKHTVKPASTSSSSPPASPSSSSPPASPPLAPDELEELEELEEPSATEILMTIVFEAWIRSKIQPCIHFMTRTFSHFRGGERYDTAKVFDQLMLVNGGDHEGFLSQAEQFREVLRRDLGDYLAKRTKNA